MTRILLITLLFTSASEAQWTVHLAPSNTLTGIYFADSLNGWVGGSGGIFHTTNGGDHWTSQWSGQVGDMTGLNPRECWATSVRDTLLHTTNTGNNWVVVSLASALDSISALGRICFVDSLHGWVVAARGQRNWILRTGDAGATWSAFPVGLFSAQWLCTFVDTLTGWVAGGAPEVARTTDGGFSWALIGFLPSFDVYDIQFLTREVGWGSSQVSVNFAAVAKSTNGGQSWLFQGPGVDRAFLCFVDTMYGWVARYFSGLEIVHTSDGGATWISQFTYSTTFSNMRRIYFADRFHGWVIGDGGLVFRTRNGGLTSIKSDTEEIPGDFKLFQNYPNPFNPETRIHYDLPQDGLVRLAVYDLLGREMATLIDEFKSAGRYDVGFNAANLASGVYFYRLRAGTFSDVKKLLLLR